MTGPRPAALQPAALPWTLDGTSIIGEGDVWIGTVTKAGFSPEQVVVHGRLMARAPEVAAAFATLLRCPTVRLAITAAKGEEKLAALDRLAHEVQP